MTKHTTCDYPKLVHALREVSRAYGSFAPMSNEEDREWLMSWHSELLARDQSPSMENIRAAVLDEARALLRELGE